MRFETFTLVHRSLSGGRTLQGATTILPLMVAMACTLVPAARATTIDATKSFTWSLAQLPVPAKGFYSWDLLAQVDGNLPVTEKNNGNWDLPIGLPKALKTTKKVTSIKGSTAQADMDFTAKAPVGVAGGGFTIAGTIHTMVQADAVKGGSASAVSSGDMHINGGTIDGVEVERDGKKFNLDSLNFKKGGAGFGASTADGGSWHDPISVSFMDLTSGDLISQDLLEMDMQSMADGQMSWGPGGLELDAPLDGVSSVSFRLLPLSAWITDPSLVDSRLSLAGGTFQATGIFAGLPWVVTSGKVTLPGGLLDSISIPYQVPAGLIRATDLYVPSLNLTESAQVAEGTPEPASALLVAIVLAAFGARAWRNRARAQSQAPGQCR